MAPDRLVLIGVGNAYRSDDAVGVLVAERLRGKLPDHVLIRGYNGDVADLIESWREVPKAILVDGVVSGASPGTIHRLSGSELREKVSAGLRSPCSTHGMDLVQALGLSEALGEAPREVVFFGVELGSLDPGMLLSEPVLGALERIEALILSEIQGGPEDA